MAAAHKAIGSGDTDSEKCTSRPQGFGGTDQEFGAGSEGVPGHQPECAKAGCAGAFNKFRHPTQLRLPS